MWSIVSHCNRSYPKGIKANAVLVVGASPWLSGKESACNAGVTGDASSIPRLERSPGGRHGNPLQSSSLENPMGREAWWATVRRVTKGRTWLSDWAHTPCSLSTCITPPGEVDPSPLRPPSPISVASVGIFPKMQLGTEASGTVPWTNKLAVETAGVMSRPQRLRTTLPSLSPHSGPVSVGKPGSPIWARVCHVVSASPSLFRKVPWWLWWARWAVGNRLYSQRSWPRWTRWRDTWLSR